MTVDELAHQLEMLQTEGKGGLAVVNAFNTSQGHDVCEVAEIFEMTVQFDVYGNGRRRRRYGRVVDGRGRPKGTERVVQIGL